MKIIMYVSKNVNEHEIKLKKINKQTETKQVLVYSVYTELVLVIFKR
jgi:hypothetical protein